MGIGIFSFLSFLCLFCVELSLAVFDCLTVYSSSLYTSVWTGPCLTPVLKFFPLARRRHFNSVCDSHTGKAAVWCSQTGPARPLASAAAESECRQPHGPLAPREGRVRATVVPEETRADGLAVRERRGGSLVPG